MAIRNRNGIWHYRFKLDGKEYAQTTGLAAIKRNRNEAQSVETNHRTALREGRNPSHKIQVRTFKDAATDFNGWAKAEYRAHPNSAKRIKTSFASLTEFFGDTPVSLISAGRIEEYKADRVNTDEVRDITIRHDLHALSTFFRYAMKQGWARENPVKQVKIPSDAGATREHVLTIEEERAFFELASGDLADAARLMLEQGMRPDEVLSLAVADVDLEREELYIRRGKTKAARRTANLTAESKRILGRRTEKGTWCFPSPRNPSLVRGRLNNAFDALCTLHPKINFVLYDLRHTFATRMAQAGVDIVTLASILGHSSLRAVQRYIHPAADHKKRAMAIYEAAAVKLATRRPN